MVICIYMRPCIPCSAILLCLSLFLFSCKNNPQVKNIDPVTDPALMNEQVRENMISLLSAAEKNNYTLSDSTAIRFFPVVADYYEEDEVLPVWSNKEKWNLSAGNLMAYLDKAILKGLYNDDYNYTALYRIKEAIDTDSVKRFDAAIRARAEIMMSDAFFGLLRDLKQGRLQPDSLSWKYNRSVYKQYFTANLEKIRAGQMPEAIFQSVQPKHAGYKQLISGIKKFTDSMDHRKYTYLNYPARDSIKFAKLLTQRLKEGGIEIEKADSAGLSNAVRKYQKKAGLKQDGKIGRDVIARLNATDYEKFKTLALTLDKYKNLPAKMPDKYIWVNLPAYNLQVRENDLPVFESKIICGKPVTPTPLLTSAVSDIVVYPTWTVPAGIISKEMLPGLRKNSDYLSRKGLYLLNTDGERVDPATVNWARFSKGIPYRIQQASGENNALGVIKFNFANPYFVYLHDTNQRYLFKNSRRSLSHGCVRVQEWEKLADYILKNDSSETERTAQTLYNMDSVYTWITRKEKHTIAVRNKISLFIRYFSCENVNGTIKFYEDIYGHDRALKQNYFAGK